MRRRNILAVSVGVSIPLLIALGLLWRPGPDVRYEVTFLPCPGGASTVSASAMNDHGQVAGVAQSNAQRCRLLLWDPNGGIRDLGPCLDPWRCGRLRINNAGQIAWGTMDPNGGNHGFLVEPNGVRHVLRPPNGEQIWVNDLNNRGQIVGYHGRDRGPWRGFVWDKTRGMQNLALLGEVESVATAINDLGQIVGSYSNQRFGPWNIFLWDPNAGPQNLGITHAGLLRMCHINNRGFIVGKFDAKGDQSLLSTWTAKGGLRQLCPARGVPVQTDGLNDANCFVACTHQEKFMIRQFQKLTHIDSYLWDPNEGFVEIAGSLGRGDVFEFFATDINNKGQITGSLRLNGQPNPFAVVLKPIPER